MAQRLTHYYLQAIRKGPISCKGTASSAVSASVSFVKKRAVWVRTTNRCRVCENKLYTRSSTANTRSVYCVRPTKSKSHTCFHSMCSPVHSFCRVEYSKVCKPVWCSKIGWPKAHARRGQGTRISHQADVEIAPIRLLVLNA